MPTADDMIEQLLAAPKHRSSDSVANRLLTEFHRGLPLHRLDPLLTSEDADIRDIGIWIASELGEKGRSLLPYVSEWLKFPSKKSRFFAIDCVLQWATANDGLLIASVVALLRDKEQAVRWKAADFLWRASEEQLSAAASALERSFADSADARSVRWLLSPDGSNPLEIENRLDSADANTRLFAVIAAARVAQQNRAPLLRASGADDPDVRNLAESTLAVIKTT